MSKFDDLLTHHPTKHKDEATKDFHDHLHHNLWMKHDYRAQKPNIETLNSHLDSRLTLEKLIQQQPHQFEDVRGASHAAVTVKSSNEHGFGKSIKVEYGSNNRDSKKDASFKVEADGTIQIFANPELHDNSSVVVLVAQNESNTDHSQTRSLTELLNYLSERLNHQRYGSNNEHHGVGKHHGIGKRHGIGDSNSFAARLALSAQKQSIGSFAHYECSHYVRKAFDEVDPTLDGLFAGSAKNDHFGDDPRFEIICDDKRNLDLHSLHPGDTIVYGPRIGTSDAGHVETMGLDRLMHSDFTHKLTMNFVDKYKWLTVYRPECNA
jgi:hypothetical protein